MTLPNFFVIGAGKAGTTSLHRYLDQHPDVYMSPVKEPSYFTPDAGSPHAGEPAKTAVHTRQEYEALFDGVRGERAIGESSTAYLSFPGSAAPAIREAVPGARLVAVLRHPAERAFSAYSMHVQWGVEHLDFAAAVALELEGDTAATWQRRYVQLGYYGSFLAAWLEHFERDRLRVHLYEDLVTDPVGITRDVFGFVEVDPSFTPQTGVRHNVTHYSPKRGWVHRVLRFGPAKTAVKRVLPEHRWKPAVEWVRRRNSVVPEFPPEVRTRLIDLYRDDIAVTQEILGRDLSAWLT